MILNEIFEQIESHAFNARLDVASGFKVFMMGLKDEVILQTLIETIYKSFDKRQTTYQRMMALVDDNPNPETMHPYDASIAGYLYALEQVSSDEIRSTIDTILATPNLWWAKRLAQYIQEDLTSNNYNNAHWSQAIVWNFSNNMTANSIRECTFFEVAREFSVGFSNQDHLTSNQQIFADIIFDHKNNSEKTLQENQITLRGIAYENTSTLKGVS